MFPASLTGYIWLKGIHPQWPGWSCPFLAVTGIPCPSCYLTRATTAALHGDFQSSLALHAFGPLIATGLILWSVLALWRRQFMPLRWRRTPAVIGAMTLGSYWLMRIILSYGFGATAPWGFP